MKSTVRALFWVETGFAALCGILAVLTLVGWDWIETLTRFDPDHHNGSFEGMVLAGLFLVCALVSFAARAEWRRAMPAAAPAS